MSSTLGRRQFGKMLAIRNNSQVRSALCTIRGKIIVPEHTALVDLLQREDWPSARMAIQRRLARAAGTRLEIWIGKGKRSRVLPLNLQACAASDGPQSLSLPPSGTSIRASVRRKPPGPAITRLVPRSRSLVTKSSADEMRVWGRLPHAHVLEAASTSTSQLMAALLNSLTPP
jgi:hypothetical protein